MTSKEYFKSTKPGNSVASWWKPEQSARSYLYDYEIELLSKKIKKIVGDSYLKKIKFLEVASGGGRVRSCLGKLNPDIFSHNADYTCVDINEIMNERAKHRFTKEKIQAKILKASVDDLPFKDNYFDIIICMNAFVHFDDTQSVIKEIERILSPGGSLFINIDNKLSLRRFIREIDTSIKKVLYPTYKARGKDIFHPMTSEYFHNEVASTKLKIISEDRYGIFSPTDINLFDKKIYIPPVNFSKLLFGIDKILSSIPIINIMSNYIFFHLKK